LAATRRGLFRDGLSVTLRVPAHNLALVESNSFELVTVLAEFNMSSTKHHFLSPRCIMRALGIGDERHCEASSAVVFFWYRGGR
jgi:hypothetical protein